MADKKFTHVKVVSASGEEHLFSDLIDMQLNSETGILDVKLADGDFVFMVDSLRYFELELKDHQVQPVRFRKCDIVLTTHGDRGKSTAANAKLNEKITVDDVISYDWKADQGIFLVFGKMVTVGVHLDHVVSFRVSNEERTS